MARYDRIARIDSPPRQSAYSGWLTLRDLEGREREPELGRRALLHFLAIRPVRRLLLRGLDGPRSRSLEDQIDLVRTRLEDLPPGDAARDRITRYLQEVGGRSPAGLVRATLDVGAAAEAGGHRYAAEEFYRTALELAEAHDLPDQCVLGLRHLGRVQRDRQEWEAATAALKESAALAEDNGNTAEWARSTESLAAVHVRHGDVGKSRALLDDVCDGPRTAGNAVARAVGQAGRCALELAEGNLEAAVEAGWEAVTALPPHDELRNQVLLNMAAAFRRLGLPSAASSCYEVVVRWAAWPEHRIEATLEQALVAADTGEENSFVRYRSAVLDGLVGVDRPLQAMLHLGLGRGALLLHQADQAREHLREAISMARDLGADPILRQAEALLDALEADIALEVPAARTPTNDASRIAVRVVELVAEPAGPA